LYYDSYARTCNRLDSTSTVLFSKRGSPDIVIRGTYKLRMPYILLPSAAESVRSAVPMTYNFPSVQPEVLSDNNDDAVHHILRLVHFRCRDLSPSAVDCLNTVLMCFCEKLLDDSLRGGLPAAPVLHVSDVVNRTLWHLRTCHPNPDHLVLFSKIT
jgi:hypothetical protein